MTNNQASLDTVFQALADPTRRHVLERLAERPMTVGELAQPYNMALPSFLQHIRILEGCGLIRTSKEGRVRTCEINSGGLEQAQDWMADQRDLWHARLDRLDSFLSRQPPDGENPMARENENETSEISTRREKA